MIKDPAPIPTEITHYIASKPKEPGISYTLNPFPKNEINKTYKTKIKTKIPPNKLLSVIPLKTLGSSNNFLALMKLKIYKKTNVLKTTVKCLDGP